MNANYRTHQVSIVTEYIKTNLFSAP